MAKKSDKNDSVKAEANGPGYEEVLRILKRKYGRPVLNSDPFRSLIATVLSQRVRDDTTGSVTERLFSVYKTPKQLAEAPQEKIEELIKRSGFYHVKARRIKEIANIIIKEHNGVVPKDMESLLSLPGVGRKTANCVLVYGFGTPAIPVDTHVHRISNRLGWVRTLEPEDTEKALCAMIPRKHWIDINHALLEFGKDICRPVGPLCKKCPFVESCPSSCERRKP